MMEMSLEQLDRYGEVCGIDVTGRRTKAQKVAAIEQRRERTADIDVLGMTLSVPIRALHDKRVTDMLQSKDFGDEQATELMLMLLGEEQYEALLDRCTDDDGVVDVEAVGFAYGVITSSEELKNF